VLLRSLLETATLRPEELVVFAENRPAMAPGRTRWRCASSSVETRALYAAHGYAEIPAYSHGPYTDHWYEKRLACAHRREGTAPSAAPTSPEWDERLFQESVRIEHRPDAPTNRSYVQLSPVDLFTFPG
jgi:hypothetical protein